MLSRVAVYTESLGIGGAEISLGHLVSGLPAELDVTVVGCGPVVVNHVAGRRQGTRTELLPFSTDPRDLRVTAAHLRVLRRLRPQVLHVNLPVPWSCWHGLAAGLACPGTAVVAVEQLPIKTGSAWQRRWKRRLSGRLAAHVAVGAASARQVEAYTGLPAGTVRTVRNGVPDHGPVARIPHDGIVVVAVGRLDPQKGFDVLLRALPDVPGARLVVVGGGREHDALVGQARALGIDGRVEFTGWTDDVRWQLARADIFVLPSRSEGFPLAIVEAMLAGLPVVATDVGSVAEAVVDGETGLLVAKDDPSALAAALRQLAEAPDVLNAMGARGRRAGRSFTATLMVSAYVSLWQDVNRGEPRGVEPG